jgi:hypothetical protein
MSRESGLDYEDEDNLGIDETIADSDDFEKIIASENWRTPADYYRQMPLKTRQAVSRVVEDDARLRRELREVYLPELLRAGRIALWEQAMPEYIEAVQRKLLYTGRVAAADGTLAKYASLSFVGAQIAVSRVNYRGDTGQFVYDMQHWGKELPRTTTAADIAEALRSRKSVVHDRLPNVFLYALMTYKEREILLSSAPGTFKLAQGPVFPYEMLTGAGRKRVMTTSLALIERLIDDGAYATIVSSSSDVELLDIGMALNAGEYLIAATGTDVLDSFLDQAHYSNQEIREYGGQSQIQIFEDFKRRYGNKVVQGVLRAHRMSRPYVFYCNADRIGEAVHILLADAANTGPRGFPLLLDMADQHCSGAFKASEYTERLNSEFARASGGSIMYQAERSSRD